MGLPLEEEGHFTALLKELSDKKECLGVMNFGLAVTTLEDVFLKVGDSKMGKEGEDNLAMVIEVIILLFSKYLHSKLGGGLQV